MNGARSQVPVLGYRRSGGAVRVGDSFWSGRSTLQRPGTQVIEEQLLLPAEEAELEPAEDIVHDRLGEADVGIARPPAGLEASVRKLLAEKFERHPMLQRDRNRQRKTVHEPGDRRPF